MLALYGHLWIKLVPLTTTSLTILWPFLWKSDYYYWNGIAIDDVMMLWWNVHFWENILSPKETTLWWTQPSMLQENQNNQSASSCSILEIFLMMFEIKIMKEIAISTMEISKCTSDYPTWLRNFATYISQMYQNGLQIIHHGLRKIWKLYTANGSKCTSKFQNE